MDINFYLDVGLLINISADLTDYEGITGMFHEQFHQELVNFVGFQRHDVRPDTDTDPERVQTEHQQVPLHVARQVEQSGDNQLHGFV